MKFNQHNQLQQHHIAHFFQTQQLLEIIHINNKKQQLHFSKITQLQHLQNLSIKITKMSKNVQCVCLYYVYNISYDQDFFCAYIVSQHW